MNVSTTAIKRGFVAFIDNSIIPHLFGWQKWAFGAVAGIAISKSDVLIEQLKTNPTVKMLGLIDEYGHIDIDTIFTELKKQAEKSPAILQIPMFGELKLTSEDVENLRQSILNAHEA